MSSRLNNSSKPVLDYSKLLKKNTQTQESDTKTTAPVPEQVHVTHEVVPVTPKLPVTSEVKTGKKLSEARYAKKLESKALKKAETEKEEKIKEEKLSEMRTTAQKAFDDEYKIQFIECKTEDEAHKKSMKVYNKVYDKLVNDAFPKPKVEKVSASVTDTKIKEIMLSDDDDDELLVPVKHTFHKSTNSTKPTMIGLQQQTITAEDLKDFKPAHKKTHSKSNFKTDSVSNNSYNEMLNKACDTFIIDILSETILNKLETSLRKSESSDKVFVPVNTDSDVITSFKGHNFTKSGFLKNTNY